MKYPEHWGLFNMNIVSGPMNNEQTKEKKKAIVRIDRCSLVMEL